MEFAVQITLIRANDFSDREDGEPCVGEVLDNVANVYNDLIDATKDFGTLCRKYENVLEHGSQ